MDQNNSEKTEPQENTNKSESLKDIIIRDKLVTEEEQSPLWYLTREDVGLPPIPNNPENQSIFGQGGTDFSKVLSEAFENMGKYNPDSRKHVLIITDGEPGQTIESLSTTTYNEEQKKQALKDIPETEYKEVDSNVEEKKIDWKEALRKHFQSIESMPELTGEITFDGIPNTINEPIGKVDSIVLYSMEAPSESLTKEGISKELSEKFNGKTVPESLSEGYVFRDNIGGIPKNDSEAEQKPFIKYKKDLSKRIKSVNASLNSENDSDNKPKLK